VIDETAVVGCAAGHMNRHNAHALATPQAMPGEALADPGSASGPGRERTELREEPRWMRPPCGSCWTAP
jgi:hypothetical protein